MTSAAFRTSLPRQATRICLVAAFFAAAVHAEPRRPVYARDGEVIRVSADEPNLIEAGRGRITAFVFAAGAFEEQSDHEAGVVYFLPRQAAPRSGFVEVENEDGRRSRVSVVLVPVEGLPSQRIVLAGDKAGEEAASDGEAHSEADISSSVRVAAIKGLMRELAGGGRDYQAMAAASVLSGRGLPGDLRLTVLARTGNDTFEGLVAQLENLSGRETSISERMLRIDEQVVAVAVSRASLAAGETQIVYMVRRKARENSGGRGGR